jgi:hypothetical protein
LATPQIRAQKWRTEWNGTGKKMLNLFEILSIVFSEMEKDLLVENHNEAKKIAKEFMAIVEGEFPHIYVLLKVGQK